MKSAKNFSWYKPAIGFHLLYIACLVICSCADQPRVEDEAYFSANVVHARFVDPCFVCHESSRLPASDGVLHGFGRDCGECHESQDEAGVDGAWSPLSFAHNPAPQACSGCHGLDRPSRAGHPAQGDCYSCHAFPAWTPPVYP